MYGPACPQDPNGGRFLTEGLAPIVLENVCSCCFRQPPKDPDGYPAYSFVVGHMSEEHCLNLNVTTPACDDGKRAVMVWIHGGAWQGGSNAHLIEATGGGSMLSEKGGIVTVCLNYRHNIFGCLQQPDAGITNLAFKDMIAGLQWIQENVHNFGGDKDNVTIFGESAGANSVAVLYGSPVAEGLFAKAICSSGSFDSYWSRAEHPIVHRQLGLDAGLREGYTKEEYLEADGRALCFTAAKSGMNPTLITEQGTMQINWCPYEDGYIVPLGGPIEGIRQGISKDRPLLTGWNADEWRLFTHLPVDIFKIPSEDEQLAKTLHKCFRRRFHSMKGVEKPGAEATWQKLSLELIRIYKEQYPEMPPKERAIKMYGELMYAFPALDMGRISEEAGAPVYYYTLGLEAANGYGACHGMDIGLYFGLPLSESAYGKQLTGDGLTNPTVRKATETVMDVWLAFAKSGDPNASQQYDGWQSSTKRMVIAEDNTERNTVVERDVPTYAKFIEIQDKIMDEIKATRK